MPIARRGFLGLGALAGVTALTSACRVPGQSDAPTSRPPTRSTHSSSPTRPSVPAFFGHPSPGHVYYGAAYPDSQSLPAWETSLGAHLALNRSYFTYAPDVNAQMVTQCRDDLAADRLPFVSVKPPGTWRDVASGAQDRWLNDLLGGLGQQHEPVFLTLHHEPENDAGAPGMLPADWVDMQRHAIELADGLAPKVTIVPVLQHWTFDPVRHDIDPKVWVVPEAAVFGVDVYNPWSLTNGREWRTFSSLTDEVRPWAGDAPIAIAEYGSREDPSDPGLASEWLRDAAAYGRLNNVVAMSYFDSGVGAVDGSWVLQGEVEQTFGELLRSDWVFRPSMVGADGGAAAKTATDGS